MVCYPKRFVVGIRYCTSLDFKSLNAAKSSGESEGTEVTTPVPGKAFYDRCIRIYLYSLNMKEILV
jgi:hypothetical protein